MSQEQLEKVVLQHRFERVSGRKRGEEDESHHLRKGISGDWKNHFSPELKKQFKARYGSVLIATGYEQNLDW